MAIKRRNRHEWETLVAQFEACELTQQEFASLHHVGLASFRGWLYRFRKSTATKATGFIDIKPTTICASADPSQAFVVLECAHKLRLIFETQPTVDYLAELIGKSSPVPVIVSRTKPLAFCAWTSAHFVPRSISIGDLPVA